MTLQEAEIPLKKLDRLLGLITKNTTDTITVISVRIFLMVAAKEGPTVSEVADNFKLSLSSASRYLLDKSKKKRNKSEGAGLLVSYNDVSDLRLKRYKLSPRGKKLCSQLFETMERTNGVANGLH